MQSRPRAAVLRRVHQLGHRILGLQVQNVQGLGAAAVLRGLVRRARDHGMEGEQKVSRRERGNAREANSPLLPPRTAK